MAVGDLKSADARQLNQATSLSHHSELARMAEVGRSESRVSRAFAAKRQKVGPRRA
jgi:hypothetical protein